MPNTYSTYDGSSDNASCFSNANSTTSQSIDPHDESTVPVSTDSINEPEGADGSDLKVATRGRSEWESMRCRHCGPKERPFRIADNHTSEWKSYVDMRLPVLLRLRYKFVII